MKTWPFIVALTAAIVAAPQAHAQRIIHVPQPHAQAARPSAGYDASASVGADDIIAAPPPDRSAAMPRVQKPRIEHRRAFAPSLSTSAPPSEPKRTVLAAPSADELSPIRPLPRWRDSGSIETHDGSPPK